MGSVWAAYVESVVLHSTMITRIQMYVLVAVLVSMVRADTTDTDSKDSASARLLDGYGAPYAPPQQYQPQPQYDSYSAPSPPVQYQASAPAPSYAYDSQPKYNEDYYKHEHHHYYHAGPPRVYKVPVPATTYRGNPTVWRSLPSYRGLRGSLCEEEGADKEWFAAGCGSHQGGSHHHTHTQCYGQQQLNVSAPFFCREL